MNHIRFVSFLILGLLLVPLALHAQTMPQPYPSQQPVTGSAEQQMMPPTGQNPVVPTGSVQVDTQNPAVYGNAVFDQGGKPWNPAASSWMPSNGLRGEFQQGMMGSVHPFMAIGMGIWFVVWTVNSVLITMLLMTLIRKFNK